jgi:hypothetical protein
VSPKEANSFEWGCRIGHNFAKNMEGNIRISPTYSLTYGTIQHKLIQQTMPEHLPSHEDKDNSDDSEEKNKNTQERPSWQKPEPPVPEKKSWWEEIEQLKPPTSAVPESEEIRKYAGERQAQARTEFGEKDEEDDEAPEEERSSSEKSGSDASAAGAETAQTETDHATETSDGGVITKEERGETEPGQAEAETEAAKEFAQEELEARAHEAEENDPTVDYLEKIAESGQPLEAERETIEEHGLDQAQAEADLLIQDLEKFLEEAAEQIGDRELSDEEMLDIAHQIIPETEEPDQAEPEPERPKAFTPTPQAPDTQMSPDNPQSSQNTLGATHTKHYLRAPTPITPIHHAGGHPPIPPSGGGGGGGGGGGLPLGPGSGANRFNLGAAMNPNFTPIWQGLSAAERARLRRRTISTALLAGVLGYYIGRHYGRKRGEREKAAELEPRLRKQEKINKQQNVEIIAGQKRLDSLKRIQAAQEKEAYDRDVREKFAAKQTPEKVGTAQPSHEANGSKGVKSYSPEMPTPFQSHQRVEAHTPSQQLKVPDIGQEAGLLSHENRAEISAPELRHAPVAEAIQEVDSAILAAPHNEAISAPILGTESPIQPENVRSMDGSPIYKETGEGVIPSSISSSETSSFYASPEHLSDHSELSEQSARFDGQFETPVSGSRTEIPTFSPGIEIPAPGAPELHSASSEQYVPETFGVKSIEAMNTAELLTAAKEMTVDGKNLGQIFQENQIDAAGLRRVMAEYAREGHPELILAQERQAAEVRHQSPEFLDNQTTSSNGGGAGGSTGGSGGLFAQSEQTTTQPILPAYDHEQYPSNTPQRLLSAYDQETISKKHHRVVIAASALIGLGVGIILGLLLI